MITDGLRLDDKLFSANKLTNASVLSCPLGKSLLCNLIGYACNLYPFFICLTFSILYTCLLMLILHCYRIQSNKTFLLPLCCVVFLHFSYSQSFSLFYSLIIS